MKPLTEQLKEAMSSNTKDLTIKKDLLGIDIIEVVALDKAATSCAKIVKEYAISYAEWINQRRFIFYSSINLWLSSREGDYGSYNNNELFALFLKETESNQQEVNIKEPEVKQESEEQLWREAEMLLPRNYGDMFENQNPNSYNEVQLHFKIEKRR